MGRVVAGTNYAAFYPWLSEVIAGFHHAYPGIRVELREGSSTQLGELVDHRRADFCLISQRPGRHEWVPLKDDQLMAILPPTHPLVEADRFPVERLRQELGREPVLSELSEASGLTPEEIAQVEIATDTPESLQRETADGLTLEGMLGTGGMEEDVVERLTLRSAMEELPEREQQVLLLRYYKNLTQIQCARVLGVSQVQISRLERRAVDRLRKILCEEEAF